MIVLLGRYAPFDLVYCHLGFGCAQAGQFAIFQHSLQLLALLHQCLDCGKFGWDIGIFGVVNIFEFELFEDKVGLALQSSDGLVDARKMCTYIWVDDCLL